MSRLDVLRDARLFAECTEQELAKLDALAGDRELDDGELFFEHGDVAREVGVVTTGEVQLELPVSVLGASKSMHFESKTRGEVVGWSALVPPYRYTLSARARGRAALATLPASELAILFDSDPRLGFRVLRSLAAIVAQRLELTRSMWLREIQRNLEERYR
jgi:CRP/FNR family cyclic AMP-dependent transcriptional regulator